MRDQYPKHGRRWSVWHPFRWVCRCGMAAYPCIVERTWARSSESWGDPQQLYDDGLAFARDWQRAERRRWARGVR